MNKTEKFITGQKTFLDEMVDKFNAPSFIEQDPISIPHQFSKKEDIEISGFLTAIISWGQRPVILNNSNRLMQYMDGEPHDFLVNANKKEFQRFGNFVHRTFNGVDCTYFLKALQRMYREQCGLEAVFTTALKSSDGEMSEAIHRVRTIFFGDDHPGRTAKHFADPLANSSAKRINMFLRWMVRSDKRKVDFGIWKNISPSVLYCPLDLHSGRVAREMGLLQRKQDDWKAVAELTQNLRLLDAADPVRYDFALFGMGIERKI